MKQIIVSVSGLSAEEKQRVNEALAKITGATRLPAINPKSAWFFAPTSPSGSMIVTWGVGSIIEKPTHTQQQVLEMAGMAKQGHVHAENMALYAEDAKTTDKPWELWQIKDARGEWRDLTCNPSFAAHLGYRQKPKTHTVNGVEVPDLRIEPKAGDRYYLVNPTKPEFFNYEVATGNKYDSKWIERGLCYEDTEEGKQAAILHAKAWLGIA